MLGSVEHLKQELPALSPKEQFVARGILESRLVRSGWSSRVARELLNRFLNHGSDNDPFNYDDDGTPHLRTLCESDLAVETQYLVEGLIPAAAAGALIADYSLGKTWLVIDLALSIAFGVGWFGHKTAQCPVIFVVAEGNEAFPRRLFGWLHEHGFLSKTASHAEFFKVLEGHVHISKYPVQTDHADFEPGLVDAIQRRGAGLIIVDTLGKSLGAEQGENDNDVANSITGMFSRMAAATRCTVLFTHHTGHQDPTRARGASAWMQGLDFAYRIHGNRDAFRTGQSVGLYPVKVRDDRWPDRVCFRLKDVPDLGFERGDGNAFGFTSAVIEPVADDPMFEAGNVDPKAYTTLIREHENTKALWLALAVLIQSREVKEAVEGSQKISRTTFRQQYNAWLDRKAARLGQKKAPGLNVPDSKELLLQLAEHVPPLIRKVGNGRSTAYEVTETGLVVAAKTAEDFDTWWRTGFAGGEATSVGDLNPNSDVEDTNE